MVNDDDLMDLYAVIGQPVGHSRSPFIHGLFAKQTGQQMRYTRMEVGPEDFAQAVENFLCGTGRGLNITVPHKLAAYELADNLTPRAVTAGAVNTLALGDTGEILGDNTDGTGLVRDFTENRGISLTGKSILILGAGGATRGTLGPVLAEYPDSIVIANRTLDKAEILVEAMEEPDTLLACGYEDLEGRQFDVVINATSASLSGGVPPIPRDVVDTGTICYDLAYGSGETPFTTWARECGAAMALKGWGMLVEQAAESFYLWRGVRPDTEPVLAALSGDFKADSARQSFV